MDCNLKYDICFVMPARAYPVFPRRYHKTSATTLPTTLPSFNSSNVRLTSGNGRGSIGIGLICPFRASATTAFKSSTLPRWEPYTVTARSMVRAMDSLISPPNKPTRINLPPLRKQSNANSAVSALPTKSTAP